MFNKFQIDIPLLLIVALLLATLIAFILGFSPYPFGLIVLTVFGIARVLSLQNKK